MQLNLLDWQRPAPAVQPPKPGSAPSWSQEEIREMVRLYVESEKPDIGAVARAMGRTYAMVSTQAWRVGLTFENLGPDAKMRICMPCRREFWSSHKGNRICSLCKRTELMECA